MEENFKDYFKEISINMTKEEIKILLLLFKEGRNTLQKGLDNKKINEIISDGEISVWKMKIYLAKLEARNFIDRAKAEGKEYLYFLTKYGVLFSEFYYKNFLKK